MGDNPAVYSKNSHLSENVQLHLVDHIVFGTMLFITTSIGIYFGYFKKKFKKSNILPVPSDDKGGDDKDQEKSMNEYLLGNRKLKPFPVAMSLIGSYVSGVSILGIPSEIYNYGTQYWFTVIAIFFMAFIVSYVYLPVFSSLKVSSSYEYLELRFNSHVRTFASIMFIIDELLYLPIVIYIPALTMNQVSGMSMHLIGVIVCTICIFYTLIGGIKAVVHTDAWQIIIMLISVYVVTIIGTFYMGGPSVIFERAMEGRRLVFFNLNTSPYERQTFWTVVFGGFFYWTSFNSVNQTMVQRYMSLPTIKKARLAIALFAGGMILFISVCCYGGLLVYARYWKCDPLITKMVQRDDQIFIMYVMEAVQEWKGIAGFFIAGIFGAALSSLSVIMNSTAAILLEDIVKGLFKLEPSERAEGIFVKLSIFILGVITIGFLFIVDKLGGILGAAYALTAIAAGTTFGVFSLGMLNPYCTSFGAIIGAISGALMSGWVCIGSQFATASGLVVPTKMHVSVEDCPVGNLTGIIEPEYLDQSGVFPLYRLSYHWINPIGIFTVFIVGSIVSYITGPQTLDKINPELLSPVIHRFLPENCFMNYGMIRKSKDENGNIEVNIDKLNENDEHVTNK